MKKDLQTDIENGMYKNYDNIASLIPYLLDGVSYSLQINAEPLLRKHVAAAIYKYKVEDSTFEDIFDELDIEDFSDENCFSQHEMVRHIIVDCAVGNTKIVDEYLKSNKIEKLNKALFFIAMGRLSTSFKAATMLLNSGFFVEVVAVLRLIIEQLAWGSFLLVEENEKKIKENRTQRDVGYLRQQLGEEYGKLYGDLSSEAHLEPKAIGKYLHMDEEEQIAAVRDRSGEKCKDETITLLKLFNGYCKLLWKGMNHFGILEDELEYYTDWYNTTLQMVVHMCAVLENKATLKCSR